MNDVQRGNGRISSRSEQNAKTQEQRIKQEEANLDSAKYDLNKVRVVAPRSGIVTRRNIDEGETAVVGTMNNAGTVLLTIADLSVIETEIEVDETDIPFIRIGQPAKVTIDAIPDKTFPGQGDRSRQQPDSGHGRGGGGTRDQLQGRRDDRRHRAERAPGVHVHGGDHDGHAAEGGRRCRSRP